MAKERRNNDRPRARQELRQSARREQKPGGTKEQRPSAKQERKPLMLPMTIVLFALLWLWAAWWYGDVLSVAREYSFWSADQTLMRHMQGRPWGALWWAGQALLQLYRWPALGGAVLALMLAAATWFTGYCLRLRGWWRLLQYAPVAAYLVWLTYTGFDRYFEAETGMIMGIPLLASLVLMVLALIIRSFSHSHRFPSLVRPPKDETLWQNRMQVVLAVGIMALAMGISQWMRPYVRVVTRMQRQMMVQDWKGMAETARKRPELSYRAIAAYYAIALVQRGEQGAHMFDIRLDYDEPYLHGFGGNNSSGTNYYLMDCDLHAGLVETAIHHAMENLTMNGPTLRSLKVLTKCALLTGEWKVAEKYLRILQRVPFEGAFVRKYKAMLYNKEAADADPEFKTIRLTEPLHDNFENFLIQPTFLGYNAHLIEGRSINALWNSLMVHIYTKTMPQFIARCQPMQGTTPPQSISEALMLMSSKNPQLLQAFPSIDYNRARLMTFLQEVKPYIKDYDSRKAHARELFPKWKGYYPYYYFFGNLKATKGHIKENEGSSNQGVN